MRCLVLSIVDAGSETGAPSLLSTPLLLLELDVLLLETETSTSSRWSSMELLSQGRSAALVSGARAQWQS